jgi:glycosyltransferase involved in cell wall biosynthesis
MLSTGHPPNDDRIYFKEARSLAKRGHEVVYVCPEGNRPRVVDQGITMRIFPRHSGWNGRYRRYREALRLGRESGAAIYHCHEPESLTIGIRLARATGARVLYDSHECWGSVLTEWFPRPLWMPVRWLFQRWEHRMIRRCDAAVGASWAITDRLAGLLGPDRTAAILNVPVAEVFGEWPRREWGEATVLCHDGHLNFIRGLKVLAEAVRLVSRDHRVVFKIVGDVFGESRAWLDAFVKRHGLESVIVRTGWLPYEEVGRALSECNIGLVGFQPVPNHYTALPNKVFNYMLYGIPFIAPDFRVPGRNLVRGEHCGLLADSTSPDSFAATIRRMIIHREETLAMGRNALEASRTKYRWNHMEKTLFDLYDRCVLPDRTMEEKKGQKDLP